MTHRNGILKQLPIFGMSEVWTQRSHTKGQEVISWKQMWQNMDFQRTGYYDLCIWRIKELWKNHWIWATEDSQGNTIRCMYLEFGRILLYSSMIELMDQKTWKLNPKRKHIQTVCTLTSCTMKWKNLWRKVGDIPQDVLKLLSEDTHQLMIQLINNIHVTGEWLP